MRTMRHAVVAALLAVAAPAPAAERSPDAASAAATIVVRGTLKSMRGLTATYISRRGTYSATWFAKHRYRLRGRIDGLRLTGTFRTRQTRSHKSYRARGSGRLGSRAVRISGGGPNTLRTATLILR